MGRIKYSTIALSQSDYREDASEALANMFDVARNVVGMQGDMLVGAFISSGMAREFERQNPVYIAGKSGIELVQLLMQHIGLNSDIPESMRFNRSPDYWLGWILARYQMTSGRLYRNIFELRSYDELLSWYQPLHEAPEQKFFAMLDELFDDPSRPTRLSKMRKIAGLSQSELAAKSGVGLRSIQMYEQRNKNIDNASAATLRKLALALHCDIESLMEGI